MKILERFKKRENINKNNALTKKAEDDYVNMQILIAKQRAYACVYGVKKKT